VLHQETLPGDLSPEHDALIQQLAQDVFTAYYAGKVSLTQVGQIFLAMKGTSNVFGWAGVAPTLSPAVRGPLAYLLGHRYRRVFDRPQDATTFFRTALEDAPPGSPLQRLARAELEQKKVP
jgi:hypothetical protein